MPLSRSLGAIVLILVIAALLVAAGSPGSVPARGLELPLFALCGIVSFTVNWIVFVPSYLASTEHYFDLTGSLTYLSLLAVGLTMGDAPSTRGLLIAGLVALWAVRLGSFLFVRVKQDGSDGRFDQIKIDFGQFLMTWTLQGLWVFLTLSCGLAAITSAHSPPLSLVEGVGVLIFLTGFGIEVVADAQKRRFRSDSGNEGRFITTGLWAWSRHPNYFGEITLWFGVAVIAFPALQGTQYVTLISPVFVYVLLTRISGVPLLESRAKKRWGGQPDFEAYKANTPSLWPRPPRARA